jgi:uncharacterized protein (TIGR01244 family)
MSSRFFAASENAMKTLTCLIAVALISVASASCTSAPSEVEVGHEIEMTDRLEPFECGTITRLHTLGGVFLASQPKPEDFEQASKSGVKTVINLRHEAELTDFDEREVVTGLGLNYIHVPWNSVDELTDDVFDRSREHLNTAERPILLHCSSANRVGAVWLPWRVLDGGLTYAEALAEAKIVGLKTPAFESKARDYIERHRTPGK